MFISCLFPQEEKKKTKTLSSPRWLEHGSSLLLIIPGASSLLLLPPSSPLYPTLYRSARVFFFRVLVCHFPAQKPLTPPIASKGLPDLACCSPPFPTPLVHLAPCRVSPAPSWHFSPLRCTVQYSEQTQTLFFSTSVPSVQCFLPTKCSSSVFPPLRSLPEPTHRHKHTCMLQCSLRCVHFGSATVPRYLVRSNLGVAGKILFR